MMKSNTCRLLLTLSLFGLAIGQGLYSQAIDENALFANTNAQLIDKSKITDSSLDPGITKKGVTMTGKLRSRTGYSMSQAWFKGAGEDSNSLDQFFESDFLIDIRLPAKIKGLVNLSLWQTPQGRPDGQDKSLTNTYGWLIKEAFIDLSLGGSASLRLGKQVLQWGRSYFWNPVDLVNYEKKNFLDMNRSREGSTGLRTHIAAGSTFNVYSYINMGEGKSANDLAFAGKIEFVLGGSEMAFSAWGKKGFFPVYGAEISSRLLGIDIKGECAISQGSNTPRFVNTGLSAEEENRSQDWVPKATLTLSRSFDWEIADRISVVAECMANGAGYADDVFNDPLRKTAILIDNAWTPNWLSRWYGALFISIAQFPDSTMTFQVNSMANLVDGSMIVSAGIAWQPVNDLTITPTIYTSIGPAGREYTLQGRALAIDFLAEIVF